MLQNYCLNAKINLTSSQNFARSVLQETLTFTFGTIRLEKKKQNVPNQWQKRKDDRLF